MAAVSPAPVPAGMRVRRCLAVHLEGTAWQTQPTKRGSSAFKTPWPLLLISLLNFKHREMVSHCQCYLLWLVEICFGIKITGAFSVPLHIITPLLVKHGLLTWLIHSTEVCCPTLGKCRRFLLLTQLHSPLHFICFLSRPLIPQIWIWLHKSDSPEFPLNALLKWLEVMLMTMAVTRTAAVI